MSLFRPISNRTYSVEITVRPLHKQSTGATSDFNAYLRSVQVLLYYKSSPISTLFENFTIFKCRNFRELYSYFLSILTTNIREIFGDSILLIYSSLFPTSLGQFNLLNLVHFVDSHRVINTRLFSVNIKDCELRKLCAIAVGVYAKRRCKFNERSYR